MGRILQTVPLSSWVDTSAVCGRNLEFIWVRHQWVRAGTAWHAGYFGLLHSITILTRSSSSPQAPFNFCRVAVSLFVKRQHEQTQNRNVSGLYLYHHRPESMILTQCSDWVTGWVLTTNYCKKPRVCQQIFKPQSHDRFKLSTIQFWVHLSIASS